jgi:hypothetical protein
MDSVRRGSLINLCARLLSVGLGVGLTLYAARLGTEQQGKFALFLAVESLLLASTSGLGVVIARQISHRGEQPKSLISACVLACSALGVMLAPILWFVSTQSDPGYSHPLDAGHRRAVHVLAERSIGHMAWFGPHGGPGLVDGGHTRTGCPGRWGCVVAWAT